MARSVADEQAACEIATISVVIVCRGPHASIGNDGPACLDLIASALQMVTNGRLSLSATVPPAGSVSLSKLGRLDGIAALRFTVQAVRKTTEMICRDAPDAVRSAGVDISRD